jgi:death on curing protein
MITIEEVEEIHRILINEFGGSHGIRDITALQSALARPFQTFDNNELYPSIVEKAAALLESILINHPFIDGNKRTGYTLLRLYLLRYEFIINIASGVIKFDGIVSWLKTNTQ